MRHGNKYTQNVGKVKGRKNGVMAMDDVGVVWVGLQRYGCVFLRHGSQAFLLLTTGFRDSLATEY